MNGKKVELLGHRVQTRVAINGRQCTARGRKRDTYESQKNKETKGDKTGALYKSFGPPPALTLLRRRCRDRRRRRVGPRLAELQQHVVNVVECVVNLLSQLGPREYDLA